MQQPGLGNTAPSALLANGTPNLGAHTVRLNFLDVGKLLGIGSSRLSFQRFREKRWCYIGVIHPQVILGCAVIHLGYISSAFAFAFDRKDQRMLEHTMILPP